MSIVIAAVAVLIILWSHRGWKEGSMLKLSWNISLSSWGSRNKLSFLDIWKHKPENSLLALSLYIFSPCGWYWVAELGTRMYFIQSYEFSHYFNRVWALSCQSRALNGGINTLVHFIYILQTLYINTVQCLLFLALASHCESYFSIALLFLT